MTFQPVEFADLPGWAEDDHAAAAAAFRNSIDQLRTVYPALPAPPVSQSGKAPAKEYFENNFTPHRVTSSDNASLFTGYFEPVLKGSRQRSAKFHVPLLSRPPDLETVVDDSLRASAGHSLTHARRTADGLEPYATRQQIEQGALDHLKLEFAFLEDPVDAFFLQVQGSGIIEFDDCDTIRVSYATKNGHPYTSIGHTLIAAGSIPAKQMSLQTLAAWLRADPERARQTMWHNRSYIFFQELGDASKVSPVGVRDIALTPDRSLAVDASVHTIGIPVFLAIDNLPGKVAPSAYRRLMVAQDVGSAIRGALRGDIYYGTGPDAGALAGLTKHPGAMYTLLPRTAKAT